VDLVDDDAPAGFERVATSAFIDYVGALYHRPGTSVFGTRVHAHHTNVHGKAHGGFLATLIDVACSRGTRYALADGTTVSTISMTLDYLNPTEQGSWLDIEMSLDRAGGRTAFTSARVRVGDLLVTKASVILALHRPKL
jgi:uncharacterized protein (TIGR00369 family)